MIVIIMTGIGCKSEQIKDNVSTTAKVTKSVVAVSTPPTAEEIVFVAYIGAQTEQLLESFNTLIQQDSATPEQWKTGLVLVNGIAGKLEILLYSVEISNPDLLRVKEKLVSANNEIRATAKNLAIATNALENENATLATLYMLKAKDNMQNAKNHLYNAKNYVAQR